jgi:hypothetical protein
LVIPLASGAGLQNDHNDQTAQTPHNLLEKMVADSDLDSLGREDFWKVSFRLQAELAAFGMPTDEKTWYERQLKFLQSHTYFTDASICLRQPGKLKNIAEIEKRLEELHLPVKVNFSAPARGMSAFQFSLHVQQGLSAAGKQHHVW